MLEGLEQDVARVSQRPPSILLILKLAITHAPFSAVLLHRIAQRLGIRSPALGRLVARLNHAIHGADIDPRASIGKGLLLQHPSGVVIGADVHLGDRVTIMSGVVLGRKDVLSGPDEGMYPTIGNDVLLGTHAVVLGPITVGGSAIIAAHALVINDVPEGATAGGVPAHVLRDGRK
jgi:serine O-acetyltransferase